MTNIPTRTVTRPADTGTDLTADVCIVGAGSAGFMAALTAAEIGKSVVLLDAMPMLGGQAVGSMLGTLCGFYSNGPEPYRVTYGPVDRLLDHLARHNSLSPRRARNSIIYQYEEMVLSRWVESALEEAGVTFVLGANVFEVLRRDRRIDTVRASTRWGNVSVTANGFVDASGDATLAWQAGLPVREPETPVYGSQMFQIEGIDEAEYAKYTRWEVQDMIEAKADEYALQRKDGFVFTFPGKGFGVANLTHIETPTDPVGASRASLAGKEQADRIMAFFRSEFPAAMGKARIRAYGLPGIRQTRWIEGRHHLTTDEVQSETRPDDAIARCTWPIELHNRPDGVHWEEFGDDHMHWVPLGSMIPNDADNLIAAGRCIDGDTAALSSVRVMGPCMAMGQAAAHALDLAGSGSVHQIDVSALQDRVRYNLASQERDPWQGTV